MTTIISESPDRKRRIIIDLSSETVTFFGCYAPKPTKFFTLFLRPKEKYVCSFSDILVAYEQNFTQPGKGPRRMFTQVTTTHGHAGLDQSWSNYEEAKGIFGRISASTPSPPWHGDPKIVTQLIFLVAIIATVTLIALLISFDVI